MCCRQADSLKHPPAVPRSHARNSPPPPLPRPPRPMACSDIERFGKVVKLAAFKPFTSAANALENINAVSESQLSDDLRHFLEQNLPKVRMGGGGGAAARPACWTRNDGALRACACLVEAATPACPWRAAASCRGAPTPAGPPSGRADHRGRAGGQQRGSTAYLRPSRPLTCAGQGCEEGQIQAGSERGQAGQRHPGEAAGGQLQGVAGATTAGARWGPGGGGADLLGAALASCK